MPDVRSCGVPEIAPRFSDSRIVGGQEAIPNSWPWQVAMIQRSSNGDNFLVCGGTIISEEWVVSAAHCFTGSRNGNINLWVARVGEHNVRVTDSSQEDIPLASVRIHALYNANTQDYDVALVRLARPLTFRDEVAPACIPDAEQDIPATDPNSGMTCVVTGWGDIFGNSTFDGRLQQARVPLLQNSLCSMPDYYGSSITSRMICAGFPEGGIDTCNGDSGGPLICKVDDQYALVGITSFGAGCALPKKPGVYTRVTMVSEWIAQNTGVEVLSRGTMVDVTGDRSIGGVVSEVEEEEEEEEVGAGQGINDVEEN